MVNEASGWFARVDHECNDRVKQIEIWLDAWEKSVIKNIPVAAALPKKLANLTSWTII